MELVHALCKFSSPFAGRPFRSVPFTSSSSSSSRSHLLLRTPTSSCLRIDGKENVPSEESNVSKLFADAQRNIMRINQQRLVATEKVKRLKAQNDYLMEKVDQLEDEIKRIVLEFEGKNTAPASSLSLCELLLRLESMVLSGLLDKGEASDLRNKLLDSKVAFHDTFGDIYHKSDTQLLSELHTILEKSTRKPLHIVHICTEMEPVASYESLGTYVTGLSTALQRKGNLVEVILPKYSNLNLGMIQGLSKMEAEFESYFGGRWHNNGVWFGSYKGIGVILIEPLHYSKFFSRERFYGYSDDFERFVYFSRASMDYIVKSGKQPDVLHLHDWQTAIVGPLFWDNFVHQGLGSTRIILTCQDFKSQCLEPPNKLELCGLDPHKLHRHDRLQDDNETYLINILKGGIIYSNKVILMSTVHSGGTLIHDLSCGLEPTLAIHKEKLTIAPYGFDRQQWDPSTDKHLPRTYSADDMEGKKICKEALIHRLSLSRRASVVVGCILHGQSEIDVGHLKIAVQNVMGHGAQFVLMDCNSILKEFQDEMKTQDIKYIPRYDEPLAHLIIAGCDIMLCPSLEDSLFQVPVGKLFAEGIKYGSAPVSLSSIADDSRYQNMQSEWHEQGSTNTSQYILSTFGQMSLSHALTEIKSDPGRWEWRMKDGMTKDFSWDAECLDIHTSAYSFIMNL